MSCLERRVAFASAMTYDHTYDRGGLELLKVAMVSGMYSIATDLKPPVSIYHSRCSRRETLITLIAEMRTWAILATAINFIRNKWKPRARY